MGKANIERIRLPESTVVPLRRGHPWVFRDVPVRSRAGSPVVLTDGRDQVVGWGVADDGPIAVRVLGREVPATIDLAATLRDRITRSDALRAGLVEDDTDCWRVVHGEGDGLSGLVIDRYGPVAVVRLYAAAWIPHLDTIVAAVRGLGWAEVVVRRLGVQRVDGGEGVEHLAGGPVPERVVVREAGMRLLVDVQNGQKTGMFLDQRTHRRMVRGWARGRTVANLFAYHGGFSVAAALGGAKRVTTLDLAPAAVEDAKENFRLNGLNPDDHAFVVADAFVWQPERPVGMLIVDPPTLARDKKAVGAARSGYRKLHRRLGPFIARDGLLVTSSCTSWLTLAEWKEIVEEGVASDGGWSWHWTSTAPVDHPVAVGHREGGYLKMGVLRRWS